MSTPQPNHHNFLLIIFTLYLSSLSSAAASAVGAYPNIPGASSAEPCSTVRSETDKDGDHLVLRPVRREVYGNGRIIDITHRITSELPSYESMGSVGQVLWLPVSIKNGSLTNNSEMKLPVHSGTHVDAPGHVFDHYFDAGFDVDTLDLELLNGPALLIDVPRDNNITAEVMQSLEIPKGVRRVLFRTLNSDRGLMYKNVFDTSYVGFMEDGARWLVDNTDIKMIGIDFLSVAAFDDLIPSHLVLLESREIIIVEGLKLEDVPAGLYVHCPLLTVEATRCRGRTNKMHSCQVIMQSP